MDPFKILNHIYQVKLFFELAMAMVLLFTIVIFSFDLALKARPRLVWRKCVNLNLGISEKQFPKMGVKYLWSIIEPICKEKPVNELFGKRLAIDTSCWVVSDNQQLPGHIVKPHLR